MNVTFAYTAQTFDGQPMTGTIDALDLDEAARKLADLRLRVLQLDPAQRLARAKPFNGADFAAFNQQLAHLSAAGLPIEQGLRLIAEDLKHGGLAQSVREVSSELERGTPLGEAFKRHENKFPPLYGTVIDAGVRTGNLSAALLNLGRHLELVTRLRSILWQSLSYPLAVLGGLLLVMIFLGRFLLPRFKLIYDDWQMDLPNITKLVMKIADLTPAMIVLAIAIFVGMPLLWTFLRGMKLDRAVADLVLPLPLVGPLLRQNLIARWCDAMKLAVQAGMDLPAAVQLAGDVVGSPRLKRDGEKIIAQLQGGQEIDQLHGRLSVLPPQVLAVVQLSAGRSDLPEALETLATMYQQQAELRLPVIQGILAPILIIGLGIVIGFVVLGLFAPIISLIQSISSPFHK